MNSKSDGFPDFLDDQTRRDVIPNRVQFGQRPGRADYSNR
jgi:hypothetical protein